MYVGSNLKAFC